MGKGNCQSKRIYCQKVPGCSTNHAFATKYQGEDSGDNRLFDYFAEIGCIIKAVDRKSMGVYVVLFRVL
jgi:hypothetical protein